MPSPSPEIIRLLSTFAAAFSVPTFAKVIVLVCGVILAPGRRTVCSALRVMGLSDDGDFSKYHRVLSRASWSPWSLSKLLLTRIVTTFLTPGQPLMLVIDDTLERRKGRKVSLKGWFRDPLSQTNSSVSAIRWLCLAMLVPVPWSKRPWALPLMTVPAPSVKVCKRLGRRHRTPVELAALLIAQVRRWHPQREIKLLADGGYAAVDFVKDCQKLSVTLISRLRMDASLYGFPEPPPTGKRGPKPKKGARELSPKQRLDDPMTVWMELDICWYHGETKRVEVATGMSLWHRTGSEPVALRWVLVRCPKGSFPPCAYFASCDMSPEELLSSYILRWNLEVTFAELRANLGFETQRGWADKTVERATPCLFGIFSLVVLLAQRLHPEKLPIRSTAWYDKQEASFSDALAAVRLHPSLALWTASVDAAELSGLYSRPPDAVPSNTRDAANSYTHLECAGAGGLLFDLNWPKSKQDGSGYK